MGRICFWKLTGSAAEQDVISTNRGTKRVHIIKEIGPIILWPSPRNTAVARREVLVESYDVKLPNHLAREDSARKGRHNAVVVGQQLLRFRHPERLSIQVSLHLVTTRQPQQFQILDRLDAFRDHREVHLVSQ
jgi:hypothetical protein